MAFPNPERSVSALASGKRFFSIMACVLIVAYFTVYSLVNFPGFELFCDADMYEDTMVARLMWETKSIFPNNWIFGNQFYVIATPNVAALFYGLTADMNLSMGLATTFMSVLIVYTFWWMLRPVMSHWKILAGELVLVSGSVGSYFIYRAQGQLFYVMASYYSCYMITLFVVFGGYLRVSLLENMRQGVNISHVLRLTILPALLSFATGMQSLRQTAIMILPLAAHVFLRVILDIKRRKQFISVLRDYRGRFVYAAMIVCTNLIGLLMIRLISPPHVTVYGQLKLVSPELFVENLRLGLQSILEITGLSFLVGPERQWGSGLYAAFLLLMALGAFFPKKDRNSSITELLWLCLLGIFSALFSSLTMSIAIRSIYLFLWYPLAALAAVCLADKRSGFLKYMAMLCMCLLSGVNFLQNYLPVARYAVSGNQNPLSEISEWIVDNDYDILYGFWQQANIIAAQSNGKISTGGWWDPPFDTISYICRTDIFSEEDNTHAVYLVLERELEQAMLLASEKGAKLTPVHSFSDGAYMLYVSDQQLMRWP